MHGASRSRYLSLVVTASVLALALGVRFASHERILGPGGVRLGADGDTYYHALRAERIAARYPRVNWVDPGLDYPFGAPIPWPPLLDGLVATLTVLTGSPSAGRVARVAALLPPFLGLAVVAVAMALARRLLGAGVWWQAGLLAALLPAAIRQGFVGRADHHVLEVLLSGLAFLAYLGAFGEPGPGWRRPALLGLWLALGFWNWPGSALYLLVLGGHVGLLHLLAPAGSEDPRRGAVCLARGALAAMLLLCLSLALAGPPGALRSLALTPVGGLSVLLCVVTGLGAGLVAALRRRAPGAAWPARLGQLLLPGALAAPVCLAPGVRHGLLAFGAGSPWYRTIREFWPLLGSGREPLAHEAWLALVNLGVTPLLAPVVLVMLARRARRPPGQVGTASFLALWYLGFGLLALLRRRFEGYAVLALAVGAAWVVSELGAAVRRRRGGRAGLATCVQVGALVLLAAPGLPLVARGDITELPAGSAEKAPLLALLRAQPAPPGRQAVLGPWSEGHEVRWLTGKPAVATPFGTDIGEGSLRDAAALYTEADPEAAAPVLARRQVGYLLLANPVGEIATLQPFRPGRSLPALVVEERSLRHGIRYALREEVFDLVVSRLYFFDGGSWRGDRPGLEGYRLLGESETTVSVLGRRARAYKLFGVVPGAALEVAGAVPGATVRASVEVVSNRGRGFLWTTWTRASPGGGARLRVPYATGANGSVHASACTLGDGAHSRVVPVGEELVRSGQALAVVLGP